MKLPNDTTDTLNLFTHKNYKYGHEFDLAEIRLMRICISRARSEYHGLLTIQNALRETMVYLDGLENRASEDSE